MKIPKATDSGNQVLLKVATCLYRSVASNIYKRAGKQVKRSLKTTDKELVKRCLEHLREKVAQLNTKGGANGADVFTVGTFDARHARDSEDAAAADRPHLSDSILKNGDWNGLQESRPSSLCPSLPAPFLLQQRNRGGRESNCHLRCRQPVRDHSQTLL